MYDDRTENYLIRVSSTFYPFYFNTQKKFYHKRRVITDCELNNLIAETFYCIN